jgi:SNF2 family DNA or RNA helicase
VLHDHRLGGCLADDMGLGKTLQAITLLQSVNEEGYFVSLTYRLINALKKTVIITTVMQNITRNIETIHEW